MKRFAVLCFCASVLWPIHAVAATGTVVCGGVHFIRAGGTELRNTLVSLRNLDLVHIATVERITVRNAFGDVVHDSGPATHQPHPVNTDFAGGLDVTHVPPGASYYLATNHIWPSGEIPPMDGVPMAQTGQNLAITVQFSKEGRRALFQVSAVSRTRERFGSGAERARDGIACTSLSSPDSPE